MSDTNSVLVKKPKHEVFDIFMLSGRTKIMLDPKPATVIIPPYLKNDEAVVLEFGYDLPKPIEDLCVTPAFLAATLSFSQSPFSVYIPWTAILAITDSEGIGVYYTPTTREPEAAAAPVPTGRPKLTLLKGGKN